MIQYITPKQLKDNKQYIHITLKHNSLGGSNFQGATHFTRIPTFDGWDNVEYYRFIGSHLDNESPRNRLGGYVYILINKAYPNKCKIGMTTSSPEKRLQQINSAGVVNDWELAYTYKCARPYDLEQAIHVVLDDLRFRSDREFFDIDLKDAIGLIIDMGDEYGKLD
jgi:hypothetical protein